MAYGKGLAGLTKPKELSLIKIWPFNKNSYDKMYSLYRCIRFNEEIAGSHQLGPLVGENTEITSFLEKTLTLNCQVMLLTYVPWVL